MIPALLLAAVLGDTTFTDTNAYSVKRRLTARREFDNSTGNLESALGALQRLGKLAELTGGNFPVAPRRTQRGPSRDILDTINTDIVIRAEWHAKPNVGFINVWLREPVALGSLAEIRSAHYSARLTFDDTHVHVRSRITATLRFHCRALLAAESKEQRRRRGQKLWVKWQPVWNFMEKTVDSGTSMMLGATESKFRDPFE